MSETQAHLPAPKMLNVSPTVVAGKWHEPDQPMRHAAFRLTYILIGERYAPQAIYEVLGVVFRDTGLLSEEMCLHVVRTGCGFAGMPVEGMG